MRIRELTLDNFGPFRRYKIPFTDEEPACVLFTGKNNEGKSNIILGLKLLSSACRSINKQQLRTVIDDTLFFKLPLQDIQNINIGRMLHNYGGEHAYINGQFEDNFNITVHLDEPRDLIYADFEGRLPNDLTEILGFIPPLGPLAEIEDYLSIKHVKASINSSLEPRHLRNHLMQILSSDEYGMVQEIINSTWQDIKLLDYEHHLEDNTINCFFKEGKVERELAWAGQGLQVWFQIVTHLIRLRHSSILVLDEPEINLHPEKQNELIQVLSEHYKGSVIIATHSTELMNNVDVSHIVHVQKKRQNPKIKKTTDRIYLNIVRSEIGSNFNFIASQFEKVDMILFTEENNDFTYIRQLSEIFGFKANVFNIPLHGFNEYPKAIYYRKAYKLLIGQNTPHTVLLDQDYYPDEHLTKVRDTLANDDISTIFTPGKEIENLFMSPKILQRLIPNKHSKEFDIFWDEVFDSSRLDAYSSYLTLHKHFLPTNLDTKTITQKSTPIFETAWTDKKKRHLMIEGKKALHKLRYFYRKKTGNNLSMKQLIDICHIVNDLDARNLIEEVFDVLPLMD